MLWLQLKIEFCKTYVCEILPGVKSGNHSRLYTVKQNMFAIFLFSSFIENANAVENDEITEILFWKKFGEK